MSRPFRAWTAAAALAVISLPAAPAIASTATPTVTVVASGLNEPKHLTFGPGGLYIPEPGTGGDSCVTIGTTSYCEGETGSVTLLGPAGPRKVLSGLPSAVNSSEGTFGPAAVAFDRGRLVVLTQDSGVNPDGTTSVQGPGADLFGKLLLARPFRGSAGWSVGPDIAAFAAAHPQDAATLGGVPGGETVYDSNPYDIVPYRGGHAIVDAAANDVLWESPEGRLSVIARLPNTPETIPAGVFGPYPVDIEGQPVPTSVAVGPDGALYVSTLPGFPASPGKAKVYRVLPGQAPVEVVTGLTEVTDLAFDARGRLLVLEYNTAGMLGPDTTPGALLRVSRSGAASTLPVSGLAAPTGLTVGPDGAVYVATHGNGPAGSGQVLRITGLG